MECETCGGMGEVPGTYHVLDGEPIPYVRKDTCPDCKGTGLAPAKEVEGESK